MTNQKRTIMGACDYTIATMKTLKKDLQDISAPNKELNWAIGGMVAILSARLLQICTEVFQHATEDGTPDAKQDLIETKERFNEFVNQIVNNE